MAQLPRASSMHVLAAAQASSVKKTSVVAPKRKAVKEVITSPTVSLLQDCLPSYGLFEASQIACPVLPQYHPQQLMELLNSGTLKSFVLKKLNCLLMMTDILIVSNRQTSVGGSYFSPLGAMHFRTCGSRCR